MLQIELKGKLRTYIDVRIRGKKIIETTYERWKKNSTSAYYLGNRKGKS